MKTTAVVESLSYYKTNVLFQRIPAYFKNIACYWKKKLHKYGVRGTSLDWFCSYLSDRQMRIKCQTAPSNRGSYSEKYSIKYDTAQGSCLGLLMFLIFCNNIYKVVEQCKLILITDHTTLFYSYKNINCLI